MTSAPTTKLQYFHYRVFDDGLAISPFSAINSDPSVGRVLCARIYPSTVGVFKRAIARHENINPSRIAALRFSADGEEVADSTTLTSNKGAPGIAPDHPFLITLSQVIDGVAEPVLSLSDPGKVAFSEKPIGWLSARVPTSPGSNGPQGSIDSTPLYSTKDDPLQTSPLSRREGELFYVHPRSLEVRKIRQGSFWIPAPTYLAIVPSTKHIGYIRADHITVDFA